MHAGGCYKTAGGKKKIFGHIVEEQKKIFMEETKGKPANIVEKIAYRQIGKFYKEKCLLEQPFIKDNTKTIQDMLIANIAKIGENIKINRFVRFEVGEC